MPRVLFTAQVPLVIAILTWRFVRSLRRNYDLRAVRADARGVRAVVRRARHQHVSVPDPERVTLQMAAAPESSQVFMLVGAAVLVPVILAYTAWSYWVFRGKVAHEGYH
jgi:cytochrome d ubiquinol oxidase subunit II